MSGLYFTIDDLRIEWGATFEEVVLLTKDLERLPTFHEGLSMVFRCREIFGLQAVSCNIQGFMKDRPVQHIHYSLAPMQKKRLDGLEDPFLRQLTKVLGKPDQVTRPKDKGWPKAHMANFIVCNAVWVKGDLRLLLTVNGATAHWAEGDKAATLSVHWFNEKAAAQPYLQKQKEFELILQERVNAETPITRFALKLDMRPYAIEWYGIGDPLAARKDPDLRTAQMALYQRDLFHTPAALADRLAANELGFCRLPKSTSVLVFNKWDTIRLDIEDQGQVRYTDVFEEERPLEQELNIKNFFIHDEPDGDALLNLCYAIDRATGISPLRETRDEG